MSRFLSNGFHEVKTRLNQLSDKFYEFKFGLTLISQKRRNRYFKLFMWSSAAVTTSTYFSLHSLPASMKLFKSWVHMYEGGDLKELNEDFRRLSETVWSDCNKTLKKSSVGVIDFFPCVGSDVISFGSVGLNGAHIGIPHSFTYNKIEDVKTVDIRFLGEHNPYAKWRSDSGQLFLKCLVMNEKAKKFAIARQIYYTNNITLLIDSLNVGLSTIVALGLGQTLINRGKSRAWRSLHTQFIVRVICFCFGFYFWYQMNQIIGYFTLLSADKKAISLGEEYLSGAIEYYSKSKARSAAFNQLIDENMRKPFTEDGESKSLTRFLGLTFERKINYLTDLKNKLKDQNQNDLNGN